MYPSHYLTAKKILESYDGIEPFHLYLKTYFRNNKKHGSKDRKSISNLCYNYFRLGHAAMNPDVEKRITLASQIVSSINHYNVGTLNNFLQTLPQIDGVDSADLGKIFPFKEDLSDQINPVDFNVSFLIQPLLYLRIRHGFEQQVIDKLKAASIEFTRIGVDSIAMENSAKINEVLQSDVEVQIQDINSQRTGELIKIAHETSPVESIWDCCAASGGKSVMAVDIVNNAQLTVSDKRTGILKNLEQRFQLAGIKNYNCFEKNLEQSPLAKDKSFDLIIADLPCTGSGTWARTPEQLFFFRKKKIREYSDLQKKIIKNVIPSVAQGGHLLYITCSVFKMENEEIVLFILENSRLKLVKQEYFKGYDMRADTMFAALFRLED